MVFRPKCSGGQGDTRGPPCPQLPNDVMGKYLKHPQQNCLADVGHRKYGRLLSIGKAKLEFNQAKLGFNNKCDKMLEV